MPLPRGGRWSGVEISEMTCATAQTPLQSSITAAAHSGVILDGRLGDCRSGSGYFRHSSSVQLRSYRKASFDGGRHGRLGDSRKRGLDRRGSCSGDEKGSGGSSGSGRL